MAGEKEVGAMPSETPKFRAHTHKRTIGIWDDRPGGTVKVAEIAIEPEWSPRKGASDRYAALIVRSVNRDHLFEEVLSALEMFVVHDDNLPADVQIATNVYERARAAVARAKGA